MPRIVIVLIALVAATVGWLIWNRNRPQPLVVSGFVESDEIRVGSRVGGRVVDVLAFEGKPVKTGEQLFRLDPFDLRERLAQAKAEWAAAQARYAQLKAGYQKEDIEQARARRDQMSATLEKLVAGPRPREIQAAREQLNASRAQLEFAESEHARLVSLKEAAQAAPREFEEAVKALKLARAEVATLEQQLGLLEEGTRKEEVAAARAFLAEAEEGLKLKEQGYRKEEVDRAAAETVAAESRVAAVQKQVEELVVTSPCDCVVEAIDLQPGDLVGSNAPSLSLLDPRKLWVRAYVPEARLAEVQLGDIVPVRVGWPSGKRFKGEVVFIARQAEFTPNNVQTPEERSKQVFRIKVMLREGHESLRVGMSADLLLEEKS